MIDAFARAWIDEHDVPRETVELWHALVRLIESENARQNLISSGSLPEIWTRHIIDSAQLGALVADPISWIDVGSGAGLPGLVVAAMYPAMKTTLVEPRPLRAEFLGRAIDHLGLSARVDVLCQQAERVTAEPAAVISARAVASAAKVIAAAHHLSSDDTIWLLPKGRSASRELAEVCTAWQGGFRIVPSVTAPESGILVGRGVRRRRA